MPDATSPLRDVTTATFLFKVDDKEIGAFMEVSGLEVTVTTEDVVEGGQNGFVHKLPGRITWPNLVLKRGVTKGDNLLKWLNDSSGESFAGNKNTLRRFTAAITLLDTTRKPVRTWEFDQAFPVKWTGPTFATDASEAATEQLEITHHGFRARDL